jgi:hypothetical protein
MCLFVKQHMAQLIDSFNFAALRKDVRRILSGRAASPDAVD